MPKKIPAAPSTVTPLDTRDQYLVLDFDRAHTRFQVFLVPPRTLFAPFGGSKSGLLTGKTPSLIVRQRGGGVWRETEYAACDKGIWQYLIAEGLTNFDTLYSNGAASRAECGFAEQE